MVCAVYYYFVVCLLVAVFLSELRHKAKSKNAAIVDIDTHATNKFDPTNIDMNVVNKVQVSFFL